MPIENSNPVLWIVWHGEEIGPIRTIAGDKQRYEMTAQRQGWRPLGNDPGFSQVTWIHFLAWAAAKRLHLLPTDLTWEEFSLNVEAVEPDEQEPDDKVGPTDPAPGPESSSSSPS